MVIPWTEANRTHNVLTTVAIRYGYGTFIICPDREEYISSQRLCFENCNERPDDPAQSTREGKCCVDCFLDDQMSVE